MKKLLILLCLLFLQGCIYQTIDNIEIKKAIQYCKDRGGIYFADDRLTVADLKVYVWIAGLRSGVLDYIPADIVTNTTPLLNDYFERIHLHPKITKCT